MTDIAPFKKYFSALTEFDKAEETEHSLRTQLQDLMFALAEKAESPVTVIHEPRPDKGGLGAPDFKLKLREGIVGYLETKKPGEDLDSVIRSPQIEKYKKLSSNLIVTDYVEWIWLRDDKEVGREKLCCHDDIGTRGVGAKLSPQKARRVAALLENFLSTPPKQIGRAKDLAQALAARCHNLREFLAVELRRQSKREQAGRLYGLYEVFRDEVFGGELKKQEFADAFAQTLGYGLFLAKLSAKPSDDITLDNAKQHISANFPLIKELVGFLDELGGDNYTNIKWLVEEILSIINGLDLAGIYEDISFAQTRKTSEEEKALFARDPYVYFYEDFLKAYDEKTRRGRGVYYTPPPVVKFIVRAINDVLKEDFKTDNGLADHDRVTVLDFATGTGTFLLEMLQQVFESESEEMHKKLVQEHVLKNFYGFEFLIAPYVVAHIKLSQFLRDKGYEMSPKERLRIYLTNTLGPSVSKDAPLLLPALSEEVRAAQKIKDQKVLVIAGNPPYAAHSRNRHFSIEKYTEVDGEPLGETTQWLQDDYVKFIRFAQSNMEKMGEGVVGVITNNSFLDAPTFRGMRYSLMQTFDQIYILDLHGSAMRREVTPEGGRDENVFDIRPGVAISLFIKKRGLDKGVFHHDLWGTREEKYHRLQEASKSSLEWARVSASAPSYLFVPQNEFLREEYEKGWSVTDIFSHHQSAIVTARDKMVIDFDKEKVLSRANAFRNSEKSDAALCAELGISMKKGWNIPQARKKIRAEEDMASLVKPVSYRPFDSRFIFYHDSLVWTPARQVMRHFLGRDNMGIVVPRQVRAGDWRHCFASSSITESTCVSNRTGEIGYLFPLHLYLDGEQEEGGILPMNSDAPSCKKKPNISQKFLDAINEKYKQGFTPKQVFGYVYAILHSPAWRQKFNSFLKRDFPRIPLIESAEKFEILSALGHDLLRTHLLSPPPPHNQSEVFATKGCFFVKNAVCDFGAERLYINDTQHFSPVSQEVWEFHIGSYQVLKKYLKDRRGRALDLHEVKNVKKIIAAMHFTLAQMKKIDKVLDIKAD